MSDYDGALDVAAHTGFLNRVGGWLEAANNVSITCNEHEGLYDSLDEAVDGIDYDEWATAESRMNVLRRKELWIAQVYPDTPVGFWRIAGSSLSEVLIALAEALGKEWGP